MAKLSDLKLAYQVFMRAYPYRKVDWRPGARLSKPLREARVAVVTTAAYFKPDQLPFDASIRGGDCSYRVLPPDTAPLGAPVPGGSTPPGVVSGGTAYDNTAEFFP